MDINPAFLTPYFTWQDNVYSLGNTTQQILGNNPQRVAAIFSLGSSNPAYISPNVKAQASSAIQIGQNNPVFQLLFRDYGGLVTEEWYVLQGTFSGNFYVLEVLYKPKEA